MSPLAFFICFVMCCELTRHLYKAVKRIRALETEALELQNQLLEHLDVTADLSKLTNRLIEISEGHDLELMAIRSKILKPKEKS